MAKPILEKKFNKYLSDSKAWKHLEEPEVVLVRIVGSLRPRKVSRTTDLLPLIELLKTNKTYYLNFKEYLAHIFTDRTFIEMVIDVGISSPKSFKKELAKKVTDKILTEHVDPSKMTYLFDRVFYKKNDHKWVENLDKNELFQLFELIGFSGLNNSFSENGTMYQIYYAIMALSTRASGVVLERDIRRMLPEYDNQRSPFLALQKKVEDMFDIQTETQTVITTEHNEYKQLKEILNNCNQYVNMAYDASEIRGISLKTNKDLNRLKEQISRIEDILPLITTESKNGEQKMPLNLFYALLNIHTNKIQLKKFVKNATQMYAAEIISHKATTGEKYISKTSNEYYSMLKAALGGGFIVGVLCIFKVLLGEVDKSTFGTAFLYSMNYALGFVIIYLLGFTLATKQPAMTAPTLVAVIEKGLGLKVRSNIRYQEFAAFFAQLFRTQLIAFVGNAIMAFVTALVGVWLIYKFQGYDIAGKKWPILLHDLDPIKSAAIFHASIAGVFLFVSSIIAGDVANRNKFYKISERISQNPVIKRMLGANKRKKLKEWYDKKWPGISSNFWFGVLMGSIGPLGIFFGLNLDIRHITFASGNFALGLFGANYNIGQEVMAWSIIGIGIIGFMNFIVSFSLSLFLAFRAKNIPVGEIRPILLSVLRELWKHPLSFVYPTERQGESKKI